MAASQFFPTCDAHLSRGMKLVLRVKDEQPLHFRKRTREINDEKPLVLCSRRLFCGPHLQFAALKIDISADLLLQQIFLLMDSPRVIKTQDSIYDIDHTVAAILLYNYHKTVVSICKLLPRVAF